MDWMVYFRRHKQSVTFLGDGIQRVTVEPINGIKDPNHADAARIDLCVYHHNGGVIRFHPGRRPKDDACIHVMPADTLLHSFDYRSRVREPAPFVGHFIHLYPPGLICLCRARNVCPDSIDNTDGVTMLHRDHMAMYHAYDMSQWGNLHVYRTLQRWHSATVPGDMIDVTLGRQNASQVDLKWWLWLAGPGNIHHAIQDGVLRVVLHHTSNHAHGVIVHVTTRNGRSEIYFRGGRHGKRCEAQVELFVD